MQFSIIALLSLAAMAVATPTAGQYVQLRSLKTREERTVKDAAGQCKSEQTLSCCNADNSNKVTSSTGGGILGGGEGTLTCSPITVNLLTSTGGDAKAQEVCNDQKVACCDQDKQTGLLNKQSACQEI